MGEGIHIDALGPTGPYRSRHRRPLTSLSGAQIGEISQVPALYVRRTIAAMRAAPVLPGAQRFDALDAAAELFLTASLGGFGPQEYVDLVSTASGVPRAVVRQSVEWIADVLRSQRTTVELAMPRGAVGDWRDERTSEGSAVWARRGEVFAVHAAGNTPAVHGLWPEALALGYKVVVRPSAREPYTALRLVEALRQAGFPPATVTLLPTDHDVADVIIAEADYAIVYGGQDVVDKYGASPTVITQGPGRSKILVTADVDWREKIDIIADSVSHLGGTACTCASAVLVEGDPEPLARALAERLGRIPSLPADHPDATLTVQPTASVIEVDQYLHKVAGDARALLGGDTIVDELASGGAVLRPAVHLVDSSGAAQLGVELPFPCVWVGPWQPADGIAPLRDSLVLTAMTTRAELIDALLDEPSIINLYLGDNPTTWLRPGIPHDGYLGEVLMRTKGMIRTAVGPAAA
ncbi:aldehyde dehydrogenase family protein [Frankia sp. AiPs1]|uniref:aldehyde dehydrogenase family protein n=1 Tax=Frankia sp. AiPs1 TaxID=573493 RepID=UPI0020433740|nr:aldehyde dehydrogenase family protein [Frankia sp. AiPs1]MCM3924497.1 aldehyde dehydrogenase family protein [Frankia sp. AiPs1]